MKTLLLKFSGPLQSWGTNSHFETRHTDLYPSKSAVIGLIAGCFGYRRNEDGKIQRLNDLNFAVRIDQNGGLLRDYHIAKSYKKNGEVLRTYVSNRYYLEDGSYIVALGHDDHNLMENIAYAVQHPYFQPYMGRRALPVTADFYLGLVEKDAVSALKELPWQAGEWYQKRYSDLDFLTIYSDFDLSPNKNKHYRKDMIVSLNQKSRVFIYRPESRGNISLKKRSFGNEHDAFAAIGD